MMNFTDEELDLLVADGYFPAYMMDIREGDLVAIPPVMRYDNKKVQTAIVTRLMVQPSDYTDEDGRLRQHTVIVFIGNDLDGRPHHLSYGGTYPCFIKREA